MYHGVQLKPQALLKEVRRGKFSNLIKTIDSVGLSEREEWRNGYHLLVAALKYGKEYEARYLLDKGATVNFTSGYRSDPNDGSPLHYAVEAGFYDIADTLLTKGSDLNNQSYLSGYTPLHRAAANQNYSITSLLLNRGAYVDSIDSFGKTPLALLCLISRHVESAKILIRFGANVNKSDNNNETPIIFATLGGSKGLVQLLLDNGANIEARSRDGSTPLHFAAMNNDLEMVEMLLSEGAKIEVLNSKQQTPLFHAVNVNVQDGIVELLLKNGANVKASNENNETLLQMAVGHDRENHVKLLLIYGADVNENFENGETPLTLAVGRGYGKIVRLLLQYKPDVADKKLLRAAICSHKDNEMAKILIEYGLKFDHEDIGDSELMFYSIERGLSEVVASLLQFGADPNAKANDSGRYESFLCKAIGCGNKDMVILLLKYGADMNENYGEHYPQYNNPLDQASRKNECEIMRILLENGCNVNLTNKRGETALHYANSVDTAKILIEYKAEINIENCKGLTPLFKAVWRDNLDVISFLVSKGASVNSSSSSLCQTKPIYAALKLLNVNAVDILLNNGVDVDEALKDGKTPLHLAVEMKSIVMCNVLLKHHCDVDLQDDRGFTCLHYAVYYRCKDIVMTLLSVGADINIETMYGQTPLDIENSTYPINDCYLQIIYNLLKQHILKLYGAKIYVCKKNLSKIIAVKKGVSVDNEMYLELQLKRYSSVVEELEALENSRLCGSISLCNILRETSTKYVLNAALIEALKLVEFEKFTRYGELIVNKIRRDNWRQKLLQTAFVNFVGLSRLGKKPDLPQEMIDIILSHLRNRDLRNLSSCYNRLKHHIKDSLSF